MHINRPVSPVFQQIVGNLPTLDIERFFLEPMSMPRTEPKLLESPFRIIMTI